MSQTIEQLKTELKQTQLAYQMAAQMSQLKAGFLARTSHELRSPLSTLTSLHQLILTNLCENPEEEREFIAQAYQAAVKLMQLIDEVITVAKLEYGGIQVKIESLELDKLFLEVEQLTRLQAANRNLKLEVIPPNAGVKVLADYTRLRQVLITLIDTAISVMEDGTIKFYSCLSSQADLVEINLDFPCDPSLWNEPTNLLEQTEKITPEIVKKLSHKLEFSPGMKLLLCSNLLETMRGQLILKGVVVENDRKQITRLQCLLQAGRLLISD